MRPARWRGRRSWGRSARRRAAAHRIDDSSGDPRGKHRRGPHAPGPRLDGLGTILDDLDRIAVGIAERCEPREPLDLADVLLERGPGSLERPSSAVEVGDAENDGAAGGT